MENYTHISMVIDRSGSMSSCWSDVVGGYKQIVKDNKAAEGKCTFSVAAFDTEYDMIEDFTDIKAVSEDLKVTPRGGTALLDAIGRTINSVAEQIKNMKKTDRPSRIIMFVQTDGEENSSKEFKKGDVKALIDKYTNKKNWQFMFVGASMDAINDAHSYGFRTANSSIYSTQRTGETYYVLSEKMLNARSCSVQDLAQTMAFTNADIQNMAGSVDYKQTTTDSVSDETETVVK